MASESSPVQSLWFWVLSLRSHPGWSVNLVKSFAEKIHKMVMEMLPSSLLPRPGVADSLCHGQLLVSYKIAL